MTRLLVLLLCACAQRGPYKVELVQSPVSAVRVAAEVTSLPQPDCYIPDLPEEAPRATIPELPNDQPDVWKRVYVHRRDFEDQQNYLWQLHAWAHAVQQCLQRKKF